MKVYRTYRRITLHLIKFLNVSELETKLWVKFMYMEEAKGLSIAITCGEIMRSPARTFIQF